VTALAVVVCLIAAVEVIVVANDARKERRDRRLLEQSARRLAYERSMSEF
jgi:hypothetical protein